MLNSYRKSCGIGVFGAATFLIIASAFVILLFHPKNGGAVTPPFETWMIWMACLKTPTLLSFSGQAAIQHQEGANRISTSKAEMAQTAFKPGCLSKELFPPVPFGCFQK